MSQQAGRVQVLLSLDPTRCHHHEAPLMPPHPRLAAHKSEVGGSLWELPVHENPADDRPGHRTEPGGVAEVGWQE